MKNTNTGGPAFPVFPETNGGHAAAFQGITTRDYFAAKGLQGMLASNISGTPAAFATRAYALADAMLKARLA